MTPVTPEINLDAILQEVNAMDKDALVNELLSIKTKQRVASKKNFNKEKAVVARKRRVAKIHQMVEIAKTLPATDPRFTNRYEEIMAAANANAAAAVSKQAEEEADSEGDEEEVAAA